jgi:hypothetical protein
LIKLFIFNVQLLSRNRLAKKKGRREFYSIASSRKALAKQASPFRVRTVLSSKPNHSSAAQVLSTGPVFGIGKVHRYPLAVLKCVSPKRRMELKLCLGLGVRRPAEGEEPDGARR